MVGGRYPLEAGAGLNDPNTRGVGSREGTGFTSPHISSDVVSEPLRCCGSLPTAEMREEARKGLSVTQGHTW